MDNMLFVFGIQMPCQAPQQEGRYVTESNHEVIKVKYK